MTAEALKFAKDYLVPPPPGTPHSIPLPGTETVDRSAVYRHWRAVDGLLHTPDPKIRTAHDMFTLSAERRSSAKCLGYRPWNAATKSWDPYVWMTYTTVATRRANLGVGLVKVAKEVGVLEEKFGVGLWCQNRPEWHIVDTACASQSCFSVSLYDTLGPDAIEYISNHATLPFIATSLPHIPSLLRLKERLPSLKVIICLDELDAGEQPGYSKLSVMSQMAEQVGLKLYTIAQVEAIGEAMGPVRFNPPTPQDIVTINYTSGTTGPPKGVVLTHRACVAAVTTSLCTMDQRPEDVGISYLPLAHIYGRLVEQGALCAGASIGYFHGNVLELVDDMKLLRPTGFQSVPRLFNRFNAAIKAATVEQPGFRGALSKHIVQTKLENLKDPESPSATNKHMVYDRIWGRKVTSAIGLDRAKNIVSGSAPLDPSLHQFLRIVFGTNFIQGYGLTESYAVGLAQLPGDLTTGNCGAVTMTDEMCLLSVPDMDYLVTDKPCPRGELLMRGNTMFSGYYRNDEETAKAMLPGGWFKTGDICSIDAKGRFKIIDRRKNVLKLAQGEYISPERIESVYMSHLTYIAQAYVHGDSAETMLVAVFGIAPEQFAAFAGKLLGRTISPIDMPAILAACNNDKVRRAVVKDLEKVGKKNRFQGYEKVKACLLTVEPFTIENELLTPTLKLKRPQTVKKFRSELDVLYEEAKAGQSARAKI